MVDQAEKSGQTSKNGTTTGQRDTVKEAVWRSLEGLRPPIRVRKALERERGREEAEPGIRQVSRKIWI